MDLVNTYLSYQLIKLLSTPFSKWGAYKLGLIDEKGEVLRKPETRIEQKLMSGKPFFTESFSITISRNSSLLYFSIGSM